MANLMFDNLWTQGKKNVVIKGRFRPNGTGTIDNTLNKGLGWTVARDGAAGKYKLTLTDTYPSLLYFNATLQATSASAGHCFQLLSETVATTKFVTFQYLLNAAGTFAAADLASDAGTFVHFELILKNSTATGTK